MQTARQGLLITISGPSGAGKGTVLKRFFEMRPDCMPSVSATTRKPREGEIDGVNYYFISQDTFEKWVEEDRFIEWDSHFSASYGTPRRFVEEQRGLGRHVILEIDVKGSAAIAEKFPDSVSIFLVPPSRKVLEDRLRGRGTETDEQIAGRLARADMELQYMDHCKYTVINDTIEEAARNLSAIVDAEMSSTARIKADKAIDF